MAVKKRLELNRPRFFSKSSRDDLRRIFDGNVKSRRWLIDRLERVTVRYATANGRDLALPWRDARRQAEKVIKHCYEFTELYSSMHPRTRELLEEAISVRALSNFALAAELLEPIVELRTEKQCVTALKRARAQYGRREMKRRQIALITEAAKLYRKAGGEISAKSGRAFPRIAELILDLAGLGGGSEIRRLLVEATREIEKPE